MGIPRCGGLHGIRSEHLCLDCQNLDLHRAEVFALQRRNELLEEQLDMEYRDLRRPRREPPPPPPIAKPSQPQQERRGL
jgi:hypothetical protein